MSSNNPLTSIEISELCLYRNITLIAVWKTPELTIINNLKITFPLINSRLSLSLPHSVSCSDGSGRSGTYILVDMVLNKMAKGGCCLLLLFFSSAASVHALPWRHPPSSHLAARGEKHGCQNIVTVNNLYFNKKTRMIALKIMMFN